MFDADVFILGGGPAGLAAAVAARQAGLSVVLADAKRPPIDKACGEGLMPDSVLAAARLGLNLPPDCGCRFKGIRFQDANHSVAAEFPDGAGFAVRRTLLQPLLAARAEQIGAELLWGHPVTRFQDNTVFLAEKSLRARWIIGADGSQSSVRRWAGLQRFRRDGQRFSYRRHYRIAPWSDYVEVFWGENCQLYVTPIGVNEICVALLTRNSRQRLSDALRFFPLLEKRLRGCDAITTERGALAATRHLYRVTRGNVALVGDASGTVDPITGEGLGLAFKQSMALATVLSAGDLNLYERAHRRLARRPRFMADFMLLMDRSKRLRQRSLAAFESHPHLFANLLAMHIGKLTPARFAATATRLGWQVITA
ncbi:MAG TPA: NAD(P)/FAD-dependent oxidoreductase [Bryobacteraceae bacterium]|nr:NAD(P)/FAD-dependent oxidoreductase [Bryobacteraceae bacterium]